MDERHLAERLITYDTSTLDGLRAAAGFVKGWLESVGIDVDDREHEGLPVIQATVGAPAGADVPTVIWHGHLDVVPGHPDQFEPRVEGDRLIGRGAYDMKGGLAAMMCALSDASTQDGLRVHFVCAPDEESEDVDGRSTDALVAGGLRGGFAITGEPTDLHIGVQAKGVLALHLAVTGTAAHSSRPWLGDNAILKAVDTFRAIETIDVDVRYLPGQDAGAIVADVRALPDVEVVRTFIWEPASVSRSDPHVRALEAAVRSAVDGEVMSVGRDGASDAVCFLRAGIPAVEFGPAGEGHHGPDEWVSLRSLGRYREALGSFVAGLPAALSGAGATLRAVEEGP